MGHRQGIGFNRQASAPEVGHFKLFVISVCFTQPRGSAKRRSRRRGTHLGTWLIVWCRERERGRAALFVRSAEHKLVAILAYGERVHLTD